MRAAPFPSARGQCQALRSGRPRSFGPASAMPLRLETVRRPHQGCPGHRGPHIDAMAEGSNWALHHGLWLASAAALGTTSTTTFSLCYSHAAVCPRPLRRLLAAPMPIYVNWSQPTVRSVFRRTPFVTTAQREDEAMEKCELCKSRKKSAARDAEPRCVIP